MPHQHPLLQQRCRQVQARLVLLILQTKRLGQVLKQYRGWKPLPLLICLLQPHPQLVLLTLTALHLYILLAVAQIFLPVIILVILR